MSQETWNAVDRFFEDLLVEDDPRLTSAREAALAAGLPGHEVTPLQGKLLHVLAEAIGARRILELGTLGGYSTLWLAKALPPGGRLVTIENDARAARVARRVLEGIAGIELIEGDASAVLPSLEGPFDLVFIDADKRGNPRYLEHALALSRPGTLIVADNVVRAGSVVDGDDPHARGVRRFAQRLRDDPRVTATALQTVGAKGYDGFVVALVTATT
ncbi:MAG TPA: O-methyltransferase [Solirubrobacteraceae bacterium]|nr:O-methyltransferase [Solirubrobacteraceae bacterium]